MSAVDTRNIARDSLFLLAAIRVDDGMDEHRVKVRNLSAGGMMAEGDLKVERGTRVEVDLRNIGWVRGTVAWVQDNRCGIAFVEEIDPKLPRASVNASGDLSTPRFVRSASLVRGQTDPSRLRKI